MASPNCHHQFHLMPFVHLGREVARGPADWHQVLSCDDNFALRNDNAIDCSAIDDAGNSAAQISSDYLIHDISRQADNVRQWRLGVEQTHNVIPQLEAGTHKNTSARNRPQDFRLTEIFRFCAASCPVPKQELMHFEVHCVANCTSGAT